MEPIPGFSKIDSQFSEREHPSSPRRIQLDRRSYPMARQPGVPRRLAAHSPTSFIAAWYLSASCPSTATCW